MTILQRPRPGARPTRHRLVEKLTAGGHRAVECALRDIAREIGDDR